MTLQEQELADGITTVLVGSPDQQQFELAEVMFEEYVALCRKQRPQSSQADLEADVARLAGAVRHRLRQIASSGAALGGIG